MNLADAARIRLVRNSKPHTEVWGIYQENPQTLVWGVFLTSFRIFGIKTIKIYQNITQGRPQNCRFSPTCSQYTIDAIERHGLLKGLVAGAARILRCNQFFQGGDDPVK